MLWAHPCSFPSLLPKEVHGPGRVSSLRHGSGSSGASRAVSSGKSRGLDRSCWELAAAAKPAPRAAVQSAGERAESTSSASPGPTAAGKRLQQPRAHQQHCEIAAAASGPQEELAHVSGAKSAEHGHLQARGLLPTATHLAWPSPSPGSHHPRAMRWVGVWLHSVALVWQGQAAGDWALPRAQAGCVTPTPVYSVQHLRVG